MTPIPTLNVNLKPCTCPAPYFTDHLDATGNTCRGGSVRIPCPIPRSVTFSVVLGKCSGSECYIINDARNFWRALAHGPVCPARPVRVSCSITGETWEESEVAEVDWQTRNERGDWNPSPMSHAERDAALAACRARWKIAKAMALGLSTTPALSHRQDLVVQRDTVFAALADMARAEDALEGAAVRAAQAMGAEGDLSGTARASPEFLAAYVEQLVEQVGVLP